jgi:hypothetical protein
VCVDVADRLLLLTIPFPFVLLNRGIVKFGDVMFSVKIGTLSIFSLITAVSFLALLGKKLLETNGSGGYG